MSFNFKSYFPTGDLTVIIVAPILLLLLIIISVPITFICACTIYKRKSKERQLNKQQEEGQWRTEYNCNTDNETEETTANHPQIVVEENYYHDVDDDVIRYNLNHNHNDDESRIAKNASDCYAIPNKQRSVNISTRSTSEVIKSELPPVDPSYLYAVPDRKKKKKNLEKPQETHDLQSLYTQPNKAMKKGQLCRTTTR